MCRDLKWQLKKEKYEALEMNMVFPQSRQIACPDIPSQNQNQNQIQEIMFDIAYD